MNQLSPTIKTLRGIMPEAGKIKIGGKGDKRKSQGGNEYRMPVKFDYIAITTLERDENDNFKRDPLAIDKFGEKPTKIPIVLLYDDPTMNFPSCFMSYKGTKMFCRGDGEIAHRNGKEVTCPCERIENEYSGNEICKWHGMLSCIIPGMSKVGGVYKFRTTSKHGVEAITSSLKFIHEMTDGILRGIPLALILESIESVNPKNGKKINVKYCRVEYAGDIPKLIAEGDEIYNKTSGRRQHRLEMEAGMKQLAIAEVLPNVNDTEKDISKEYYPEGSQEENEKENEKESESMPELDIEEDNINKETSEVSSQPVIAPDAVTEVATENTKPAQKTVDDANKPDTESMPNLFS